MYVKRIYYTLILLSLIVLGLSLNQLYTDTGKVRDLNAIINDVANRLNLDLDNPKTRYELYYSGRLLQFSASEIKHLLGVKPIDVAFGYFNGVEWYSLPLRIYDDILVDGGVKVYSLPSHISKSTKIIVKLPSTYPVKADIHKNPPEFARGAKTIAIELIDPRTQIDMGTIYLFIGGYVRVGAGYQSVLSTYEYEGINDAFRALEPARIRYYMIKAGYDSKTILQVLDHIHEHPLILHRDLEWRITWEPPVPDGGGSGSTEGNVIELRPQPIQQMLSQDFFLTSSDPSKTIKIRTYDPDVSDVDWRKLLLMIIIARKDEASEDIRDLIINIYNTDYGISKNFSTQIYSNRINTIVVEYTPSVYGSTCKYIYVEVKIDSSMDSNEEWGFRIQPTFFLYWSNTNGFMDQLNEYYHLSLFGGNYEGVETILQMNIKNEYGYQDKRVAFIQPQIGIAFNDIYNKIEFQFTFEIRDSQLNLFPYKVTLSIGGVSTASCYIGGNNEPVTVKLNVETRLLASLYAKYEPVPITINVRSESSDSNKPDDLIELKITSMKIGLLKIRPMYTRKFNDGTILYTSTRGEDDDIWDTQIYKSKSRFQTIYVLAGDLPNELYVKNYMFDLQKSIMSQSVLANYKIVVGGKGYDGWKVPINNGLLEYLKDMPADKVVITMQFPQGIDLSDANNITEKFDTSGVLPNLPEIPPLIPFILQKIPHPITQAIGRSFEGYNLIAWSWNKIAVETENKIHSHIDPGSNKVIITWRRGWLNNKDFNGDIKIIDVKLNEHIYEEVNVTLDISYGTIHAVYTWRFKT